MGVDFKVCRSTLADANARRPSAVFADIYFFLYEKNKALLADSRSGWQPVKCLYAMDSTTVTTFTTTMRGTGKPRYADGKRKGGLKAHTIVQVGEDAPCFVCTTEAACNDRTQFEEMLRLPKGSVVAIDKGYTDYRAFQTLTDNGLYYVTRMRDNARYEVLSSRETPEKGGIVSDETVMLFYNEKPAHRARRVVYEFEERGKTKRLVFLTNHFGFAATTITKIYRKRWKIELLFKDLKRNFPLKYFYGDSQNAIETQVWVALIALLLLRIIQRGVKQTSWAFSNLVSYVRHILMSYVRLYDFLNYPDALWKERQNAPPEPDLFAPAVA
jgi:hypothetical protein